MYYIVYKIENTLNNKIYIGSHKTKNINDGYMGSGKYLRYAIKKYGEQNFIKEILFVFDNPVDMYDKEKELVNEDFIATGNTYNLKRGGFGGFDFINNNKLNNKSNQCSKAGRAAAKKGGAFKGKKHSEKTKKLLSQILKGKPGPFINKKHSDATKKKMSLVKKGKNRGKKNSQFGTCWVNNGLQNLKIKKDQLDIYLNRGYTKGRLWGVGRVVEGGSLLTS